METMLWDLFDAQTAARYTSPIDCLFRDYGRSLSGHRSDHWHTESRGKRKYNGLGLSARTTRLASVLGTGTASGKCNAELSPRAHTALIYHTYLEYGPIGVFKLGMEIVQW
jgi:hypothetical protein